MPRKIPPFLRFERRGQPMAPVGLFARRLGYAVMLWVCLAVVGLGIGIMGYATIESMGLVDAYVNAAMILSGMGPVGELKTQSGKIFAGSYALFSGLFVVIASGFVLAPVLHRVLHSFHIDEEDARNDD